MTQISGSPGARSAADPAPRVARAEKLLTENLAALPADMTRSTRPDGSSECWVQVCN